MDSAAEGAPDRESLERLMERHWPRLLGFVRLQAGPALRARESCSDLVQSVCREALADLDRLDYRGEVAFRQWLFKRALRKIQHRHEYYRAQKRDIGREVAGEELREDAVSPLLDAYATFCTPSRELMDQQAVAEIEQAVDRLPEAQRESILLHRIVGLEYSEIAAETGRSEGAIRTNVYRGLAELGLLLSEAKD